MSVLLAVQASRGPGRSYHRASSRTGHSGGYGGYGSFGRGHGCNGRGCGGYGRGYGGRHRAALNRGSRGGYGAPPPSTGECKPPCYWTYGVPGQQKCVCPVASTLSRGTLSRELT
ncbi:hypothetical protein AAVH_23802 [Aphelenchoides avenae]|nr:hypothetical protein AAVH_23802 [Aphelenchus avenae]